jgi:hypothetical protein
MECVNNSGFEMLNVWIVVLEKEIAISQAGESYQYCLCVGDISVSMTIRILAIFGRHHNRDTIQIYAHIWYWSPLKVIRIQVYDNNG